MKLFYFFLIIILFNNCSFDNKTSIWKNKNDNSFKKKDNMFEEFERFSILEETFNKKIYLDEGFIFKKIKPVKNQEWKDIFYKNNNNFSNFSFKNSNELILKSKKISRNKINKYLLFENQSLILSDEKGNLFVFSIVENKIIEKFNFYKNRFKKINKKINLIVETNIIYASDNLGYIYAYDYINKEILWAKNYKIPFRSNLKLIENKLVASNQNNELFFLEKKNGNIIKLIPSEESSIKNNFINNLSLNKKSLFFLNSFGSLYSINNESLEINWFINLNKSMDLNPSNIFFATQIINKKNNIIVSTSKDTYIIDSSSGLILNKFNFSSSLKPIIYNDYIFFITNNNYLICIDLTSKKILYSLNINEKIAEYTKTKKGNLFPLNLMILNNKIFIFLKNSHFIKFDLNGDLIELSKLPSRVNSEIILVNEIIFYLNKKNNLIMIN